MTSITRTLTLSLSVAAAAIFLVLLGTVIWLDVAREREQAFCQAAAAILSRATVVDPGRGLGAIVADGFGGFNFLLGNQLPYVLIGASSFATLVLLVDKGRMFRRPMFVQVGDIVS